MYHQVFGDKDVGSQCDAVPRARLYAVAAVAFVLDDEGHLAYVAVFDKQRLGQTYARVEVEVGHRHGVFEDVPEAFLRIEQVEVGTPGQRGLGEALCYRNLEFDVGVFFCRFRLDRRSEYKVVVLLYVVIGLV